MDTKKDAVRTVEEMKAAVQKFCEERDWDQFHHVKDLAIGAVTESAELLEIFRFKTDVVCDDMIMSSPEDRKKISDEQREQEKQ